MWSATKKQKEEAPMLPLQALEKGLISTFWWTFNTHQIPAVRRKTHLSSQRRAPIYCRCWEADAALRKTSGCIAFLSCTDLPAHTRRKQYRETAAALTQQHSHVGGAWKQKPFKVQGEAPCFPVNNMLLWTFLRLYEDFLGFFLHFYSALPQQYTQNHSWTDTFLPAVKLPATHLTLETRSMKHWRTFNLAEFYDVTQY